MDSDENALALIMLFAKRLGEPKGMGHFLSEMERKIAKIEKKRLKGMKASSDTVATINLFMVASAFLMASPAVSKSHQKRHKALTARLARFSYLG